MFFRNQDDKATRPTKSHKTRRLSVESMEDRKLMAADAFLTVIDRVDTLVVEGTNNRDLIYVDSASYNSVRVKVKDQWGKYQRDDNNQEVHRTFLRNDFEQIQVNALGGNDDVFNRTGERMIANGGTGNDYLSGGSGNDHLMGGPHVDKLLGNDGNDLLEGGSSTDYLYGGDDDDTLYGDSGDDWLYGQADNDGMFGGSGRDRMYAGSGFDRVLRDEGITDYVYNTSTDDAIIWFKSGSNVQRVNNLGQSQTVNGETWSASEIKAVDEALALLHETTENTRLLKDSNHSALTFFRMGMADNGVTPEGWSNHLGNISITDAAFDLNMPLKQTVIHEVGHNWDWNGANASVDEFRALSGWTQTNILSSTWRRWGGRSITINPYLHQGHDTTDGWWYDSRKTNFVRDYSRTNPYEDFATSFTAYILGDEYFVDTVAPGQTTGGGGAAPEKLAYMAQFVGAF